MIRNSRTTNKNNNNADSANKMYLLAVNPYQNRTTDEEEDDDENDGDPDGDGDQMSHRHYQDDETSIADDTVDDRTETDSYPDLRRANSTDTLKLYSIVSPLVKSKHSVDHTRSPSESEEGWSDHSSVTFSSNSPTSEEDSKKPSTTTKNGKGNPTKYLKKINEDVSEVSEAVDDEDCSICGPTDFPKTSAPTTTSTKTTSLSAHLAKSTPSSALQNLVKLGGKRNDTTRFAWDDNNSSASTLQSSHSDVISALQQQTIDPVETSQPQNHLVNKELSTKGINGAFANDFYIKKKQPDYDENDYDENDYDILSYSSSSQQQLFLKATASDGLINSSKKERSTSMPGMLTDTMIEHDGEPSTRKTRRSTSMLYVPATAPTIETNAGTILVIPSSSERRSSLSSSTRTDFASSNLQNANLCDGPRKPNRTPSFEISPKSLLALREKSASTATTATTALSGNGPNDAANASTDLHTATDHADHRGSGRDRNNDKSTTQSNITGTSIKDEAVVKQINEITSNFTREAKRNKDKIRQEKQRREDLERAEKCTHTIVFRSSIQSTQHQEQYPKQQHQKPPMQPQPSQGSNNNSSNDKSKDDIPIVAPSVFIPGRDDREVERRFSHILRLAKSSSTSNVVGTTILSASTRASNLTHPDEEDLTETTDFDIHSSNNSNTFQSSYNFRTWNNTNGMKKNSSHHVSHNGMNSYNRQGSISDDTSGLDAASFDQRSTVSTTINQSSTSSFSIIGPGKLRRSHSFASRYESPWIDGKTTLNTATILLNNLKGNTNNTTIDNMKLHTPHPGVVNVPSKKKQPRRASAFASLGTHTPATRRGSASFAVSPASEFESVESDTIRSLDSDLLDMIHKRNQLSSKFPVIKESTMSLTGSDKDQTSQHQLDDVVSNHSSLHSSKRKLATGSPKSQQNSAGVQSNGNKQQQSQQPQAEVRKNTKSSPNQEQKQPSEHVRRNNSGESKVDVIDKNIGTTIVVPKIIDTISTSLLHGQRKLMSKMNSTTTIRRFSTGVDLHRLNYRQDVGTALFDASGLAGAKLVLPQAQQNFMEKQPSRRFGGVGVGGVAHEPVYHPSFPRSMSINLAMDDSTTVNNNGTTKEAKTTPPTSLLLAPSELTGSIENDGPEESGPPQPPCRRPTTVFDSQTKLIHEKSSDEHDKDDEDDGEYDDVDIERGISGMKAKNKTKQNGVKSKEANQLEGSASDILSFYKRHRRLDRRTIQILVIILSCTLFILGGVAGTLATVLTYNGDN